MKNMITCGALTVALVLSGAALAHPHGPMAGPVDGQRGMWGGEGQEKPSKEKMMERMKQKRSKMLRNRVGLSETTAVEVEAVMVKNDPERKQLLRRKKALRHRVQALIAEDSDDQNQFQAAMREFRAIEERHVSLRQEEMKALSALLTPKEQVVLHMTLHRFQKKMRRAMEDRRRDRRGGQGCEGGGGFDCDGPRGKRERRGDRRRGGN